MKMVRINDEIHAAITTLAKEDNRSTTIMTNMLLGYALNRWPDGVTKTIVKPAPAGATVVTRDIPLKKNSMDNIPPLDSSFFEKPPKKNAAGPQADKITVIKPSPARAEQGLCKIHGAPLDYLGRCLQKGCKYA